jgi:hypothetical protein
MQPSITLISILAPVVKPAASSHWLHDNRWDMLVIFKAARITDGGDAVICRETSGTVNSAIECGVVMVSIPFQ